MLGFRIRCIVFIYQINITPKYPKPPDSNGDIIDFGHSSASKKRTLSSSKLLA